VPAKVIDERPECFESFAVFDIDVPGQVFDANARTGILREECENFLFE
jgi:hypothetical protein